jgi:hypothetical protein
MISSMKILFCQHTSMLHTTDYVITLASESMPERETGQRASLYHGAQRISWGTPQGIEHNKKAALQRTRMPLIVLVLFHKHHYQASDCADRDDQFADRYELFGFHTDPFLEIGALMSRTVNIHIIL